MASSFIKPCMPSSRSRPPGREAWLHEIKLDGWRGQLHKSGSLVRLYSKRGNDLSFRFPDIVAAAAQMPIGDIVIDGEITAVNADGVPDFEALQRSDTEAMQTFWAFDLLKSGQENLRSRALVERKARLAEVIGAQLNPHLRYVEHFEDGEALLAAGMRLGLGGIVSKKLDAPYRSGPSHSWLTIKISAWREAKQERRQWSKARGERRALRADVKTLKAESKTHSELIGEVSGLIVEIYHEQEVVSEIARSMEERVFRLEEHAGFVKVH
jgi:bifunctional non-homologous end joining protein LigD